MFNILYSLNNLDVARQLSFYFTEIFIRNSEMIIIIIIKLKLRRSQHKKEEHYRPLLLFVNNLYNFIYLNV